ncbi:MAG TPA: FAD-binding oxidoreductase [Candidatus Aminicenantes bacterium]|nr:FAD-binding oxidoreductase [Candidatus Aminicenantes bacterium]
MILDSSLEVKLYTKESVELPNILKNRLPRIQFISQPESIDDIQEMFSYAIKNKLSIIPRGAATYGMGGIAPLRRSIMADLTHLNRILDFDEKKKTIYFEAGLRWWDLKNFLKNYSLDLYTYPTSLFSTVGGWLSTGGYGVNSFAYGHISNLVDSIEIIAPQKKKRVNRQDREFKYFMETEGQMGIISKVKLRIREAKPSKPYLVFFNKASEAAGFLSEVSRSLRTPPVHLSFFDRHRLEHKNLLLNGKVSFPNMEGILVVFEDLSSKAAFLSLVERKKGILAENYLTAFLWNERYFPFSVKHFHPSILGCETILPLENLDHYLRKTRKFGKNYGIPLSTEATLINENEAVVFTIFPSDPKKIIHFVHLFLTYSLTHITSKCGGKPYGIGTWNLPLLKKKFSDTDIKEYLRLKEELDPLNLLNPAKSFSPDWRIAYFLKMAYSMSALFSNGNPFFKPFLKILSANLDKHKRSLFDPEACANCGACIAVCPAYFTNRSEIVTAKGKLFLLKRMLNGSSIPEPVAENIFLCLHCHLCEYVCQSKLKLMPVWDKLEAIAEKTSGRPEEKIDEFIKKAESHPAYTKLLDFLSNSSNNNHQEIKNV